jgi:hypothetical protein
MKKAVLPAPPRAPKTRTPRLPNASLAPEQFDEAAMLGELTPLFQALDELQQRAVQLYAPEVEALVRTNSRDIQNIERTLDGLLNFCANADVLVLFKRLCRHYWEIDPVATASYIDSYRDMWDNGESGDLA